MTESPWSPDEQTQLRTALSLLEALPSRAGATPVLELEPILTRFRIRGNAYGFTAFAARNLRAALGEAFVGAESPDLSAWVILDDFRWSSSDLLLSDQTLTSMATGYTLSSSRKIGRKAALYRSLPWFVIGLLTTPAIYLVFAGVSILLTR
jgi:hypothetical protein